MAARWGWSAFFFVVYSQHRDLHLKCDVPLSFYLPSSRNLETFRNITPRDGSRVVHFSWLSWSWPDAAFSNSNVYFHISFAQVSDDILNLCIRLYISWIWSGEQEILFYFTTPFPFNRNVGREFWPWSELEGQKAIERISIYLIYLCLLFASVLVEYRQEIILNSILRLWTHPFFLFVLYVPAI